MCCKIALIGDSGVGKTDIISRYSGDYSSNGISYASKILIFDELDIKISLDIWDTAGQEKYQALTKFFYKDVSIAFLVYDITNKQSFQNIKNYWYPQLKNFGEKDIIIGVVGNNVHLYEEEAVEEYEAREFAKSIGGFFEGVSTENNQGINKLFMDAAQKYVNKKLEEEIKLNEKYNKIHKLKTYLRF